MKRSSKKAGVIMKPGYFLFATLIAVAGGAGAQTMSVDEYLVAVQARHPFFVKEQMKEDIEQLRQDRFLGVMDWHLSSSPYLAYEQPIQSSAFSPTEATSGGIDATVDRTFWGHGGRLSLSWRWDFIDQKLPSITVPGPGGPVEVPVGPGRFHQQRLFATYLLPLLQNRGGGLDRLEYELTDFEVDLAAVQALENQEGFLLEITDRYVDWAFEFERARIARDLLNFAEEQLETTRRKRRANLVDEVDVLRGRDAVQVALQNVVSAESSLKAQKAQLSVLARNDSINDMDPDMDLYAIEAMPAADEVVTKISRQRIVRLLRTRAEQLRRQQEGFEDLSKPQLSLILSGGLQDGDGEFVGALGYTEPVAQIGLGFSYPLRNRTAEADVARSNMEIQQIEKEIESVSLDLEARLRSILIGLAELEQIMDVNREQIETARRQTEEEQRLYNQGRNELNFVIQSRNSEALSELNLATNAAAYRKLVFIYRALVDDLLPDPREN
jgi:outer membrane protein TolC